jgi:hypothetical protein
VRQLGQQIEHDQVCCKLIEGRFLDSPYFVDYMPDIMIVSIASIISKSVFRFIVLKLSICNLVLRTKLVTGCDPIGGMWDCRSVPGVVGLQM